MKFGGSRLAVATLVAASFLVVAAPAEAAIRGVVTDASTHQGIKSGVEICAFEALTTQAEAEANPGSRFCTTPEENPEIVGEYNLGGVSPGFYKVAFLPSSGSHYATQFYDHVGTWEEASVIQVEIGGSNPGIDAALVEQREPDQPTGSDAPPVLTAPVIISSPAPTPPKPKPLHCKKGFKKRKVKGKLRCVKIHRPKHRNVGKRLP